MSMSAYCTIDDVRSIVDSDMTDPEISILIDIISAFITNMIDLSIGAQALRGVCMTWTAYRVMLKDPNSRSLGEYSEQRERTLEMLWEQVLFMIEHAPETGGIAFIATREELS